MTSLAICPGSFDPPTNGHVDVVERACRHFSNVLVAVMDNPAKEALFSQDERVEMLSKCLSHLENVEVRSHRGLLVDLAGKVGARVIVKGLRATSDLENELQMAQLNSSLMQPLDTLFIATNPKWSFISSSLVKEVARYGGDVRAFVPAPVKEALAARF